MQGMWVDIVKKYYLHRTTKYSNWTVFPYHDEIPRWRKERPNEEYIGPFTMPGFPTFADALKMKLDRIAFWYSKRRGKLRIRNDG